MRPSTTAGTPRPAIPRHPRQADLARLDGKRLARFAAQEIQHDFLGPRRIEAARRIHIAVVADRAASLLQRSGR